MERATAIALVPVIGAFVAGRAIVLVAAALADTIVLRNPALTSGADGFLLRSLTSWDGWFYLGIAREGYHAAPVAGVYHDYAFLPLYPMLVRILAAPVPGSEGLVAVILSNLLFALALALLYLLGRDHVGERRAVQACALLAISPFSVMFSMAYGESLFLVLSVGAFLAAERGDRPVAGACLAAATLCRLPGAVLALPIAIVFLRQDGWRPRPSQAWALLGPVAAAGFLAWVAALTGSSSAYSDNQAAWGRDGLATDGPTIASAPTPILLLGVAILCASLFPLVYARADRLRPEYVLLPMLAVGVAFASGSLESIGRYATVAFPLWWLIARPTLMWRRVWPLLSAGLLGSFAIVSFAGYWVP
jgi:uncharacterized membrane protein